MAELWDDGGYGGAAWHAFQRSRGRVTCGESLLLLLLSVGIGGGIGLGVWWLFHQ